MKIVMAMRSEQYQKSVANRKLQEDKDKPNYTYLLWDQVRPLALVQRLAMLPHVVLDATTCASADAI